MLRFYGDGRHSNTPNLVYKKTMSEFIGLPKDSRLYIIDDKGVVFRLICQRLYSLNTFATFLWCCFEENESLEQAEIRAKETFDADISVIKAWIAEAIENWFLIGLLGESIPSESKDDLAWVTNLTDVAHAPCFDEREWQKIQHYRLSGCDIAVYLQNSEHAEPINSVIGHLLVEDNAVEFCDSEIHVCLCNNQFVIYRNRQAVAQFDNPKSIPPSVKSIALQEAIDHYDYQFSFHSGVISNGESLVLLSGMAGAGKSTLTAGLMRSGLTYYSDEVALLSSENQEIRPFPIALCSKSSAWPVLSPLFPLLDELPVFDRLDGKFVRYMRPDVEPSDRSYNQALPVKALVFPRYNPDTSSQLILIDRVTALHHLMDECLSIKTALSFDIVGRLIDWINSVECYELPNNNLEESVALVSDLMC